MRLYLLRHGESEGNAQGRLQGRADFPLSNRGREQAAIAARHLATIAPQISACYASPLLRAAETASIVASALHLTPTTVPELAEMSAGSLDGLTWDELATVQPPFYGRPSDAWLDYTAWNGMSQAGYFGPIHAWLDATFPVETLGESGEALIVAHAVTLRAIVSWALDQRERNQIGLHFGNCTLVQLNFHGGRQTLRRTIDGLLPIEHQARVVGAAYDPAPTMGP